MDLVRYLDNTAEQLTGSDGVAASDILKHDAALRADLSSRELAYQKVDRLNAELLTENERLKQHCKELYARTPLGMNEAIAEQDNIQQQDGAAREQADEFLARLEGE
jgi:hypothetical protein